VRLDRRLELWPRTIEKPCLVEIRFIRDATLSERLAHDLPGHVEKGDVPYVAHVLPLGFRFGTKALQNGSRQSTRTVLVNQGTPFNFAMRSGTDGVSDATLAIGSLAHARFIPS
jgi:hypothetical protein